MEESVTKELGTRAKRWIAMNSEFNSDGTLKAEVRQKDLEGGMSVAAIDSYEAIKKADFEEWRKLDETDPEPWVNYTAYDFFTEDEKKYFNPDGTLKDNNFLDAPGSFDYWMRQSRRKMIEVDNYNSVSERDAAQGINHGQWLMDSRRNRAKNYARNMKQHKQDMRNHEEISSLSFDVDADSYF